MIRALSAYLLQTPKHYETVALVKNAAIVIHSEEVRLMPPKAFMGCDEEGGKQAKKKFIAALCRDWAKHGYSETAVRDVNMALNSVIVDAFTYKFVRMAFVGGSKRFPTVTAEGECDSDGRYATMGDLIREMVWAYGGRKVS